MIQLGRPIHRAAFAKAKFVRFHCPTLIASPRECARGGGPNSTRHPSVGVLADRVEGQAGGKRKKSFLKVWKEGGKGGQSNKKEARPRRIGRGFREGRVHDREQGGCGARHKAVEKRRGRHEGYSFGMVRGRTGRSRGQIEKRIRPKPVSGGSAARGSVPKEVAASPTFHRTSGDTKKPDKPAGAAPSTGIPATINGKKPPPGAPRGPPRAARARGRVTQTGTDEGQITPEFVGRASGRIFRDIRVERPPPGEAVCLS